MENRAYHQYHTPEENKDLWEYKDGYSYFCMGSCIAPGKSVNVFQQDWVNSCEENRSLWVIANESNCYVGVEWRHAF